MYIYIYICVYIYMYIHMYDYICTHCMKQTLPKRLRWPYVYPDVHVKTRGPGDFRQHQFFPLVISRPQNVAVPEIGMQHDATIQPTKFGFKQPKMRFNHQEWYGTRKKWVVDPRPVTKLRMEIPQFWAGWCTLWGKHGKTLSLSIHIYSDGQSLRTYLFFPKCYFCT